MIVLFTFVACLILSNLLCFNIKLARFVKEVKLIYKIQITLSGRGSSRKVAVRTEIFRYTCGLYYKTFRIVIYDHKLRSSLDRNLRSYSRNPSYG